MKHISYTFSGSAVDFYFESGFGQLKKLTPIRSTIIVTDEHVYAAHKARFKGWNTIVLKAGEAFKIQPTVESLIATLIKMEADRQTTLVGVGGGVITDLTGYAASIYMRGIRFGFVPTTILALVDASIGGKNGVDVDDYKNLVGVIRQPSFILHDTRFLSSLPKTEWANGFAEIIKHACIRDASMFRQLSKNPVSFYKKNKPLGELLQRNAQIKIRLVQKDVFEKGERRLLNFGHTLGHALETQYALSHGQAISIGMVAACRISEQLAGFDQTEEVIALLEKYKLPMAASFDKQKVFNVLRMDKKREHKDIHYILLEKIGKGVVRKISLKQLEKIIRDLP